MVVQGSTFKRCITAPLKNNINQHKTSHIQTHTYLRSNNIHIICMYVCMYVCIITCEKCVQVTVCNLPNRTHAPLVHLMKFCFFWSILSHSYSCFECSCRPPRIGDVLCRAVSAPGVYCIALVTASAHVRRVRAGLGHLLATPFSWGWMERGFLYVCVCVCVYLCEIDYNSYSPRCLLGIGWRESFFVCVCVCVCRVCHGLLPISIYLLYIYIYMYIYIYIYTYIHTYIYIYKRAICLQN